MCKKMRCEILLAIALIVIGLSFSIMNGSLVAEEKRPVKIGLVTWDAGPGLGAGRQHTAGFNYAISYVNQQGILGGRKVQGVFAPQGATAEMAKAAALRLCMKDNVKALVGPMYDIAAPAGLPIAQRFNVPFGTLTGSTWLFEQNYPGTLVPIGTGRGRANVNLKWAEKKGYKTAVLVFCDIPFCRDIAKTVENRWKKPDSPVKVLDIIWYTYGEADITKELTKAVGYNPDLIWSEAWAQPVTLSLMKTLHQLGYKGNCVLDADMTMDAIKTVPKEITEGYYINIEFPPDPSVPENKAFCDYWMKQTGKLPESNEESVWSMTVFLLLAMDKAGTDGDGTKDGLMKIHNAMRSLKWRSPYGEDLKLSKEGLALWTRWNMTQIRNGGFKVSDYITLTPNDLLPWL